MKKITPCENIELDSKEKKFGGGSERDCIPGRNNNGTPAEHCYLVPNTKGRIWQTQNPDYVISSRELYAHHSLGVADLEILVPLNGGRINVRYPDSPRDRVKTVLKTRIDPQHNKKRLKFEDLIDPDKNPDLLQELVRYIKTANIIYKENKRGLDPLGGEIVLDILRCTFRRVLLAVVKNIPLFGKRIAALIGGVQGQVRNLQLNKGEIISTDIGMHDFSREGKWKPITEFIHFLSLSAMVIMVRKCNQELPEEKQVPADEIEALPYNQGWFYKNLAKVIWVIMQPMFVRHMESQSPDEKG